MGHPLFNILINYVFHILDQSPLYNYTDDNTLSYSHCNHETVADTLPQDNDQTNFKTNFTAYFFITFSKNNSANRR